jgi:alanine-glyoxylate transaminase/serine-glyoxylate transaminase/serine-pyruvate transaminase
MVVSLEAALQAVLDEGLESVYARHAEAGRILTDGLAERGLALFAAEGHRLPELTTVKVPDDVDSAAVRGYLL